MGREGQNSPVMHVALYLLFCEKRYVQIESSKVYLGRVARKPVFGVSDKAIFKPDCSATETS